MNTLNGKFAFLTSTRFWALIIGSAGVVLVDPTVMIDPWFMSFGKFLSLVAAGFTLIRTVDRTVDTLA